MSSGANQLTIEAEDLTLSRGYVIESNPAASGGELIRLSGRKEATALFKDFSLESGEYTVTLHAFDETDGDAILRLSGNGFSKQVRLDEGRAAGNATSKNRVAHSFTVGLFEGDDLTLTGIADRSEYARVDKISFELLRAFDDSPEVIEIQSEDMQRSGFRRETIPEFGEVVSLRHAQKGTLETIFKGKSGHYNLIVNTFDEDDGESQLTVRKNNSRIDRWRLDEDLNDGFATDRSKVQRVIKRVYLRHGDEIKIEGERDGQEFVRIESLVIADVDASSGPPKPKEPPIDVPGHPQPKGKVLLDENFNTGRISSDWRREDSPGKSHSLNIVNDPTGKRGKVARFESRKSDPRASDSYRSELSGPMTPIGSELHYEFSLLLPNNWKHDPKGEIVSQWHSAPDQSKGETWEGKGGPPLAIHVDGNDMYVKTNWNTGSGKKSKILWRGDYDKGDWMDFSVQAKWSNSSNGYVKIWKDGKQIVNHKGPNTHHNSSRGIYFKTGVYKYSWKRSPAQSTTTSRVLYVDDVRIVDI